MDWVWVILAVAIAWVGIWVTGARWLGGFCVIVLSPLITVWLADSIIGWESFYEAPKEPFLGIFGGVALSIGFLFRLLRNYRDRRRSRRAERDNHPRC